MILAAGIGLSVLLDTLMPSGSLVPAGLRPLASAIGVVLVALALGLDLWAMATMARQRANILPHRAATALVTTGPFALSRNPIYLGNTLLLVGIGLALANLWFLPVAGFAALAVDRLAIRREEAHLGLLFPGDWERYRERTGRWFGRGSPRP
jgi:protein-S-isoprenylcysteine O-methyltransferase Ste14